MAFARACRWPVFAVVFAASLAASTWRYPQSSDGTAILATARSLWSEGTLAVDARFARDNGYAPSAKIGIDGRAYAKYGVGAALWHVPWLALADVASRAVAVERGRVEPFLLSLLNPLLTSATAVLVASLAGLFGAAGRSAGALGMAYGLTTFAWAYAVTDGTEALQAFLVTLAAWAFAAFERHRQVRQVLLAGVALACGLLVKPTLAALGLTFALGVLLALRRRGAGTASSLEVTLAFSVPLAGAGAAWVALNLARFGAVFSAGYNDPVMTNPLPAGLYGFLASFNKGLPWYAPLTVAAPVGLWRLRRSSPAAAMVIAATVVAWVTVNARFYDWGGGWCWGPRYLLPVVPMLVAACAPILASRAGRVAIALPAAVGFAVALLGVVISEEAYRRTTMRVWLAAETGTVDAGHAHEAGRMVAYPRPAADVLPEFSSIGAHWWLARVAIAGCDCEPTSLLCSCRRGAIEANTVFTSPPWKSRYPEAVPLPPWGTSLLQPRVAEVMYRAWVHDPRSSQSPSDVP